MHVPLTDFLFAFGQIGGAVLLGFGVVAFIEKRVKRRASRRLPMASYR